MNSKANWKRIWPKSVDLRRVSTSNPCWSELQTNVLKKGAKLSEKSQNPFKLIHQKAINGLQMLQNDLIRQTTDNFAKIEAKLKAEAPRELGSAIEKVNAFKGLVKEQIRKCNDTKNEIKFAASLIKTSKVGNIIESSMTAQQQLSDCFDRFWDRLDKHFQKIVISDIPSDKIVTVMFPVDNPFFNKDGMAVGRREKSPALTPTRSSMNLGLNKLSSPNRILLRREDMSIEKSKERKSSFLTKKTGDKTAIFLDGITDNSRRMNRSYIRPEIELRDINTENEDPSVFQSLGGRKGNRERSARHMEVAHHPIKETQEENLLVGSNFNVGRLEIDLNAEPRRFSDRSELPTLSNKALVRPETNRNCVPLDETSRSKSPHGHQIDMLKKMKSMQNIRVELPERLETQVSLRPRIELALDTTARADRSRNRSRASSKNLSTININLDEFTERPSNRVSQLMRNPKVLRPPHIDFSSARLIIRIDGRRYARTARFLH